MRTCPVHQRNGKINYNSFLRPEDVEYEANEIRSEAIMYDMNILNAVQEYVHDRVSYARDRAKYNRPDYWKFSQETLVDGFGDCEDTSILMTSILLNYTSKVRMVVGWIFGQGHAWVEVKYKGTWYLVESTSGNKIIEKKFRGFYGYRAELYVYQEGCEQPDFVVSRRPRPIIDLGRDILPIGTVVVLIGSLLAVTFSIMRK